MNYGNIKYNDIANGLGVRTVLFVSGCRNRCGGCFQKETWDFNFGEKFTIDRENEIIDSLKNPYVSGLTLLGGDPFEKENQEALLPFIRKVKKECGDKNIWAYTGYILDKDLIENGKVYTKDTKELLSYIDILVDGPFIEKEKSIMLKYKGSKNQRVIDMNYYRKNGKIKEVEF